LRLLSLQTRTTTSSVRGCKGLTFYDDRNTYGKSIIIRQISLIM